MNWIKKGIVYDARKFGSEDSWNFNHALTPTPVLLDDRIRVFVGFRDQFGLSRIGFVDVERNNPQNIIEVSSKPCLDIGTNGMFDDNGVILGDVIKHDGGLRMYYVGFQLVNKVKFMAFSGMAISLDGGRNFERYSKVPILDRMDDSLFIRAIHTAIFEGNHWRIWFASGNDWEEIDGRFYPNYNIYYTESKDGVTNFSPAKLCIDYEHPEYRIGRPRVYKLDVNKYIMFFTKGDINGGYFPGIAKSVDGINWTRLDAQLGIELSDDGWDSRTLCYPSLLKFEDKVYMFYNGNNMGLDGFGVAELSGDLWSF